MDCRNFLTSAQFLLTNNDEAAYRSSISRAYYACFLYARKITFTRCSKEFWSKTEISKEKGLGHDKLLMYLNDRDNENIRRLHSDLAGLLLLRKDADYEMEKPFTKDDAINAISDATEILKSIDKFSNDMGESAKKVISSFCSAPPVK